MELCEFIDKLISIQLKHGPHLEVIANHYNDAESIDQYAYSSIDIYPAVGVFEDDEFDDVLSIPPELHKELNINAVLIN